MVEIGVAVTKLLPPVLIVDKLIGWIKGKADVYAVTKFGDVFTFE